METKECTIVNAAIGDEEYKALNTVITLIDKILVLLDETDVYNIAAHKFLNRETLEEASDYLKANFEITES